MKDEWRVDGVGSGLAGIYAYKKIWSPCNRDRW